MPQQIGVAVIGAGMVGRAHANAYRNASTVYDLDGPGARLVAIADVHEPFATDAARRFGYARAETDWRAVIDPRRPISWRYLGGPGTGVLADIGSHLTDLAEFFCGPTTGVQGTTMATLITERPKPLGVAVGHAGGVELSDETTPVENEDICTF